MAECRSVLFVHGLWMTGAEGWLLGDRLRGYGLDVKAVRYASTTAGTEEVLRSLAGAIGRAGPEVGLIGHSLGGLLILRCLQEQPELEVGPVVLLGSSVNGSLAARRLARLPGSWCSLGDAAREELLCEEPRVWARQSPVGIIAGDCPVGVGVLLAPLEAPHDGAVSVAETRLRGASAHQVFHVNHMGLLLSAAVARAAAGFLTEGRFPD